MAGSTFGKNFRVTTWGESHGAALGAVIDGCPSGLRLSEEDIQKFLDRRKPGTSAVTTSRKEDDKVEILSGVFENMTEGTPISLMIRNTSQRSSDYSHLMNCYRPGHADMGYDAKYGFRDYRGGGRSSGRETAARVAAGAVAIKILEELGISVHAVTSSIGDIILNIDTITDEMVLTSLSNTVVMPDCTAAAEAEKLIKKYREEKDSIGGSVFCEVTGLPAGIGEPVFDKLDATISHALFSIGAVKAVEIGDGISASLKRGSENNDAMRARGKNIEFKSNHAGGILGGLTSGAPIRIKAYFKPTPSIYQTQKTVSSFDGRIKNTELTIEGRHDPVIVPRAVVVVECMTALTILDALMDNTTSKLSYLKRIYER